MTPSELVPDLPLGPGDPLAQQLFWRIAFSFLADHVHDLQLEDGSYLPEPTKTAKCFRELAEALRHKMRGKTAAAPVNFANHELRTTGRVNGPVHEDWCPDCGHIHADPRECGFPQGGGRVCLCDKKVPA